MTNQSSQHSSHAGSLEDLSGSSIRGFSVQDLHRFSTEGPLPRKEPSRAEREDLQATHQREVEDYVTGEWTRPRKHTMTRDTIDGTTIFEMNFR